MCATTIIRSCDVFEFDGEILIKTKIELGFIIECVNLESCEIVLCDKDWKVRHLKNTKL